MVDVLKRLESGRLDSLPVSTNVTSHIKVESSESSWSPDIWSPAPFYPFHKWMLDASTSINDWSPVCVLRIGNANEQHVHESSSNSLLHTVNSYYERIENQLATLLDDTDPPVEEEATRSALTVIEHLRRNEIAPPELTWQGDDAIVMLWALGDTTYAITVTDGEIGYVVRRNKKTVKMADSIRIDAFRLSDLR